MDFGMFSDFHIRKDMSQAEAFEESFSQVEVAEKLGMDCVWLAEHHFTPQRSVLASPLIIASAIASRTSRIRIGLAVQVLPLTNPLRVAEEAATVDHISKGRFDFGIGRSGLTRYYQGYNVPYSESRGRFFEALEVIMKAWSQEQFSHEGEYYSYQDVTLVPKPYQKPYPPVRVALASEETFPLVGSLGYPIFVGATTPMPQLQERLQLYREAWREAGTHQPGRRSVTYSNVCGGNRRTGPLRARGQHHASDTVCREGAIGFCSQSRERREDQERRQHPLPRPDRPKDDVRHTRGRRGSYP